MICFLPQIHFAAYSQIKRCCGNTQRFKYSAHRRKCDRTLSALQFRDLRLLHTDSFSEFLLCKVLMYPGLLDRLSQEVSVQIFFEPSFHCVALWCANLPPDFICQIICGGKNHLCHLVVLLSLKYALIMLSAFSISFFGVFCVFFTMPCVTKTNAPISLSQKANSL